MSSALAFCLASGLPTSSPLETGGRGSHSAGYSILLFFLLPSLSPSSLFFHLPLIIPSFFIVSCCVAQATPAFLMCTTIPGATGCFSSHCSFPLCVTPQPECSPAPCLTCTLKHPFISAFQITDCPLHCIWSAVLTHPSKVQCLKASVSFPRIKVIYFYICLASFDSFLSLNTFWDLCFCHLLFSIGLYL